MDETSFDVVKTWEKKKIIIATPIKTVIKELIMLIKKTFQCQRKKNENWFCVTWHSETRAQFF